MHTDIKSVLYAGSRDELNSKLFERDKRIAELEAALRKIASCEKRCDGDVVDVARQALGDKT